MAEGFYHILFIGIAFFQSVFMLVQWIAFRRQDYLYYILYILSCLLFILFRLDASLKILPFHLTGMADEYVDQPLIVFAFWMYIRFGYFFLNLKNLQPSVYAAGKRLEYFFITFIVLKCLTIPIGLDHTTSGYIFLAATFLLALAAIPVIVRLLKQKNLLNNFLVIGSLCITIAGMAGPIFALIFKTMDQNTLMIYVGLELGILAEMLLLNTGFILKNRILHQQVINAQKEIIERYEENEKHQSK